MSETFAENKLVAETILQQLGGRRFTVMTGAKNYLSGDKTLSFRIPRSKGISGVRIVLNANDLYRMEFLEISGSIVATKITYEDVYGDDLREMFTAATGLVTHL